MGRHCVAIDARLTPDTQIWCIDRIWLEVCRYFWLFATRIAVRCWGSRVRSLESKMKCRFIVLETEIGDIARGTVSSLTEILFNSNL